MTGVSHQALIGSGARRASIMETISGLGLTSGLQLCLDAGDAASYDGSSQSWLDVSGAGSNFFRGSGSGSDASDPTFNGSAGGRSSSEYFSFDGGDYFTIDPANPTWVNSFHKNNALGTVIGMWWFNTSADFQAMIGNEGTAGGIWFFEYNNDNTISLKVFDDSANTELSITSTATATEDAWHLLGFSLDEAAGSHLLRIDGTSEAKAGTYPSPSTNNTNVDVMIGRKATTGDTDAVESGARVAFMAVWDRALSAADMDSVFTAVRGKYGI